MRRLVLSLFFFVFMSHSVFAEVSVKASCNFAKVKDGLYWTCPCNRNGEFWVDIEGDPENREEWNIEIPAYKWESASFTFNPDDQAIVYYALQPTDYGQNHTATVTVKWSMTHKLTGEKKTVTKKAQLQLDAVELSVLVVTGQGEDGGYLVDNREGEAKLLVSGASADTARVLPIEISSKPVEKDGIINKCGTDISFAPKKDILLFWDTSKIYWYGVVTPTKTNCCSKYNHEYEFTAKLDGNCIMSSRHAATMPDENPMCAWFAPLLNSHVRLPEPVPGVANFWRCEIVFLDYTKTGKLENLPTTDQYADETEIEENYHKMQWEGTVPTSEGGQGDCYTAKGLQWWLGWIGGGPWYVTGMTADAARAEAQNRFETACEKEEKHSAEVVANDWPFTEVKAKAAAGYNAAWKYHCAYEGRTVKGNGTKMFFPLEANVTNCWHQAYP